MTKEKHQIKADLRTVLGRKVKQLRKENLTPASVYGHNFEPKSIQFKSMELERLYDEVGESGLVELLIDSEKLPILFKNPQYHPIEGNIIHIDCYKVNMKEKITATVPVEFIGESQAVKDGNVLIEVSNEVEVEALPSDLPESITVDISVLNAVDDMITVGDLKIDTDKVEILTQPDQVIAKIEEPRAEEEVITEAAETVVAPAMNQKTEEEKAAAEAAKKEE